MDEELKPWKRAGIAKRMSFHLARYTFAATALAAGVPLKVVSRLLGHRSIRQTERYAQVIDESMREAVAKLPRLQGQES